LAQAEEKYLAALDYRPLSWETQKRLAQVADRCAYQLNAQTWREARDLLPELPHPSELNEWCKALERAVAAQPERAPTRGMIAMLLDAFPSGRPPNLDAYADTLLHDAMALGHTPYEVALACRNIRRDTARKFLPSVGEWVAALEKAQESWRSVAKSTSGFIVARIERVRAAASQPEPEPAETHGGAKAVEGRGEQR
jgi:hypothetical protein